jgi:hypothetical protein
MPFFTVIYKFEPFSDNSYDNIRALAVSYSGSDLIYCGLNRLEIIHLNNITFLAIARLMN